MDKPEEIYLPVLKLYDKLQFNQDYNGASICTFILIFGVGLIDVHIKHRSYKMYMLISLSISI